MILFAMLAQVDVKAPKLPKKYKTSTGLVFGRRVQGLGYRAWGLVL